ncbi:hypothetical protein FEF34_00810 [Streptomyces marianii]|uniref:Uncharacterized protein n=1 Tax=Streptomyces marianii TaxID=1817406 RepID=A0A5R9DWP7_9ACTN|nr:hypothetical protein FEF34_00810 [Streptomyces marianii]
MTAGLPGIPVVRPSTKALRDLRRRLGSTLVRVNPHELGMRRRETTRWEGPRCDLASELPGDSLELSQPTAVVTRTAGASFRNLAAGHRHGRVLKVREAEPPTGTRRPRTPRDGGQ